MKSYIDQKSNFCDDVGAYVLVRGYITIIGHNITQVALKYCAPFVKCIPKIDGTKIHNVEHLHLAMSMYNLFEYSSNSCDKTGSLWFYSKDEATNFNVDVTDGNNFNFFKNISAIRLNY